MKNRQYFYHLFVANAQAMHMDHSNLSLPIVSRNLLVGKIVQGFLDWTKEKGAKMKSNFWLEQSWRDLLALKVYLVRFLPFEDAAWFDTDSYLKLISRNILPKAFLGIGFYRILQDVKK